MCVCVCVCVPLNKPTRPKCNKIQPKQVINIK